VWIGNTAFCVRFPSLFSFYVHKDAAVSDLRVLEDSNWRWEFGWRRMFEWERGLLRC